MASTNSTARKSAATGNGRSTPTTLMAPLHRSASQIMTCPASRSRFRWLRKLCSLMCAVIGCCSLPAARAQNLDKPLSSIDEEITAFSFGPEGGIAFSVYHNFKTKKYDLEHDDI